MARHLLAALAILILLQISECFSPAPALSMLPSLGSAMPLGGLAQHRGDGTLVARVSPFGTRSSFARPLGSPTVLLPPLSGGGVGGGGRVNGKGWNDGGDGDGGDDGGLLPDDVALVLGGRALTKEMREAVIAGRIGAAEVANFLKVQDNPVLKWVGGLSRPMMSRLVANDRFFVTLSIELLVGGVTKMLAEVVERSKRGAFWKEIDFVASDMALELLGDFGLVFFLAPTAALLAPPASGPGRAVASLPGFFLQKGAFTPSQRAACFLYKALTFWGIGFATSAIGHSTTKALIEARGQSTSHMASVLDNSVQWGNFLGVSSNLRYQLISSWEARLMPLLFKGTFALNAAATSVRLANCYSGGVQWLLWTRLIGIQ